MVNMYDAAGTPRVVNVQRGTVVVDATENVTISAVDMSKTIVLVNSSSEDGAGQRFGATAELTTSTNLRIKSFSNETSNNAFVVWQVVEFG